MRSLSALLTLGLLVAVHEFGHLLAARLLGMRVSRYGFGFGPPLLSFRVRGTRFTWGAVPFGGFVHIPGMNPHEHVEGEDASFATARPWRRILVLGAGPFTNVLVAVGVLVALHMAGTHVAVPMTVGTVVPGSEAARAQLIPGDVIQRVDGQPVRQWAELVERIALSPELAVRLSVLRAGVPHELTLTPRLDGRGLGRIGVTQQYVFRTHGVREALGLSLVRVGRQTRDGVLRLARLVTGRSRVGALQPSALLNQASSAAETSSDAFQRVLVGLSLALAVFYLLPLPALDGGKILLLAVEALTGKRIPPRVETVAQTLGFLAFVAAVVMVATSEVRHARHPAAGSSASRATPAPGNP